MTTHMLTRKVWHLDLVAINILCDQGYLPDTVEEVPGGSIWTLQLQAPVEPEPTLMAFWRKDTFPYLLWGEVTHLYPNGNVQTKEYGPYQFRPYRLVPIEAGRQLVEKVENLRLRKVSAINTANVQFDEELNDLLEVSL